MSMPARNPANGADREFDLTDRDFRAIVDLVRQRAGIALADHKRELVYSRLSRRLRALKLPSFAAYIQLLSSDAGNDEIGEFINAITTNLTAFFREGHHFDHMRYNVVEPCVRAAATGHKSLLVWSAGCSTGEEPYSIAMTIASAWPNWAKHDVRILATDLDTNALARCRAGRYRRDSMNGVPAAYRSEFFRQVDAETAEIAPAIRKMISFRQLNLQAVWPMRKSYDVIFCRNVMIYFDDTLIRQVLAGFHARLKPGGTLYIGHSESASKHHDGFERIDKTTYRRSA
jgi:chemotaxis protein methyltransferase CheR